MGPSSRTNVKPLVTSQVASQPSVGQKARLQQKAHTHLHPRGEKNKNTRFIYLLQPTTRGRAAVVIMWLSTTLYLLRKQRTEGIDVPIKSCNQQILVLIYSSEVIHFLQRLTVFWSRSALHLRSVLVGVHPINSVSLGFVLTEGLQDILDFPKFFLKENVLLAGRLHLVVKRKDTPGQESGNPSCI